MGSKINGVLASDIHFFSPNIPAVVMEENLVATLTEAITVETDVIILAGDIFHQVVALSALEVEAFMRFIVWLFDGAKSNGIYVRILRGTFSHDNYQLNTLIPIAAQYGTLKGKPVIKVINTICVEELMGTTFLYKPDNCGTPDALGVIQEKLASLGMDKVDLFINHGYLEPLLPTGLNHVPENTFSLDQLDTFVKGFTFNGHVHTRMEFRNALSNGCFESTRFDEMGPKGLTRFEYDPDTCSCSTEFIVNRRSTIFEELILDPSKPFEDSREEIREFRDQLLSRDTANDTVHLRVKTDDREIFEAAKLILTEKGRIRVKRERLEKPKTEKKMTLDQIRLRNVVTEDNFVDTVRERLREQGREITRSSIEAAIA